MPDHSSALEGLLRAGWRARGGSHAETSGAIPLRYHDVPPTIVTLISAMSGAVNADNTVWFLNADDYDDGRGQNAFRWNEWERLSMEAAAGDEVWRSEIIRFWDFHLPFLLSVEGGYAYLAFTLDDAAYGAVVFGEEPRFEDTVVLADTVDQFVRKVDDLLRGASSDARLKTLLLR